MKTVYAVSTQGSEVKKVHF